MTRKTGFTLIELLVVIAIIAILAAIIFPVYMKTKESAYRNGDMSSMNSIRNALQLYRADQEAYPPQILGYATLYASGPNMGQVMPANTLRTGLYPRRVDSIETMRPAYDRPTYIQTTAAVWPHADSRAVGTAPILDLNGDGIIDATDDNAGARQAYSSTPGSPIYFCSQSYLNATNPGAMCDGPFYTASLANAAPFYEVSGYDAADVKIPPASGATDQWEIHYTLRWTSYSMTTGNRSDDPRQRRAALRVSREHRHRGLGPGSRHGGAGASLEASESHHPRASRCRGG